MPEELLTAAEAAAVLRVSPRTVRNWAVAGKLPEVRPVPGGHRRYRKADIDRMAEARTVAS